MNEKGRELARLYATLAQIHEDWVEEMRPHVPYNPAHDSPGSDYSQHHVDADATWAQEQVLRNRSAPFERRIAEIRDEPPEWEAELLSKASDIVEFHLALNGEAVLMLVKHDFDAGLLSYREGGEWIPVKPGDEIPVLDESDLFEVIVDATEIWDAKEGGELKLSDFERVALDGL